MVNMLLLLLLLWSSGAEADPGSADTVRLVGGASACAGTLQVKQEAGWRRVDGDKWSMTLAAAFCERLDCGSAVSVRQMKEASLGPVARVQPECIQSGSALKDCLASRHSYYHVELTCSNSVRLLNGSSLCSGRLQVRTNPSDQTWSSVCEADLHLKDAEVVCRELGCGAPSVLQGALYGDVQTSRWSPEFQCGGHETALLDCRRSGTARSSCSSGQAAGLTCSEPENQMRLVGGASRCAGTVEVNHLRTWRPAYTAHWSLKSAAVFCQRLDCGSPLSVEELDEPTEQPVWLIDSDCVHSGSSFSDCSTSESFSQRLKLNCSDTVRLLNGSGLCSGRLQVRTNPSDPTWSSVCEADLDLKDAEVVCGELGCGAPSVLQGVLYGDMQTSRWSPEFQCGGHESALLDCRSSGTVRNSCSSGRVAGLTCSEPLQLVGGAGRCSGTLQVKHQGEWRPGHVSGWNQQVAAVFCQRLGCGPVDSIDRSFESSTNSVWQVRADRLQAGDDLRDSVTSRQSAASLKLTCSAGGRG
ncbi:unnamed protein product [Ophioblennius macclurei]